MDLNYNVVQHVASCCSLLDLADNVVGLPEVEMAHHPLLNDLVKHDKRIYTELEILVVVC